MSNTIEFNNVDHELTSLPEADPWDDDGERSEVTGTAGQLIWGTTADKHYAAAHAVGAELREQRRRHRPVVTPPGRTEKWLDPEFDYEETVLAMENGEPVDYWDALEVMKIRTRGLDKLPPKPPTDEWREIPGYPGYVMHSSSREVWRSAREVPSRLPAKKVKARNGAYTLSGPNGIASRGINALYRSVFPELFPKKNRKRKVGEWDDTVQPIDSLEWESNGGVTEWLASGSARIVER